MMKIDVDIFNSIKGFMADEEAQRLFDLADEASRSGPVLEIGSYCGKSAYVIGLACKKNASILYSVDHHKGSEEQQPGQEYFDPEIFDEKLSRVNTLPFFLETISSTGLEDSVVPVVSDSRTAGKMWRTKLSMLFIDGGHAFETVSSDFNIWGQHIMSGGLLVMHDIFFDPDKGGLAPGSVYEKVLESGRYQELEMIGTLGAMKKL